MKTYLKFVAVVLISLIIIIPFYVADVYAGSLQVIHSSGSGEVDNYFDGIGDMWTIRAKASLAGKTVKEDMVKIVFEGREEYFHKCDPSLGNYFICEWNSDWRWSAEDVLSYPVVLTDPDTRETWDDSATLKVDGTEPSITINSALQEGDKVEVDLEVVDGDPETSSLLDKIEFWAGGMYIDAITGINKHEYKEVVELTIPKIGTFDDQTITVKAYDRLLHEGTATSSGFVLDLTAPVIDDASFKIGNLVDYASSGRRTYDISVNITEDKGLNVEDVVADFTALGLGDAVVADECTLFAGTEVFECVWKDRYFSVSGSIDVEITATDINGNSVTDTISKQYNIDDTAPRIEFIGTTARFDSKSYVKLGEVNTIIVELREGESGISADDIWIDFRKVNPDLDYVGADRCELSADDPSLWICYWNKLIKREGIIMLIDAPDKAGNELPSDELVLVNKATLEEDDIFPELIGIKITSLGPLFTEEREYLQSEDYITIEAEVRDNIGVTGYADFSDIIIDGGDYVEADECTPGTDSDIWTCTWLGAGPLLDGYIKAAPMRFTFEDFVGNAIHHTEYREILAVAGDITPDFWNIGDIENYPEAIDKQTTHRVNHRMYFKIPLETPNQNVQLLATGIRSCVSLQSIAVCENNDCLNDYYLVNNQIYSTEPYLVLELKTFVGTVGALDFNCKIDIFSQYGNKAVDYPETKEINVTIPFYNLPLGVQDISLTEKIKDKRKALISGFYGIIGTMNELLKWGRLVCQVLGFFNRIVSFYNTIVLPSADILRAFPPTVGVATGICRSGTALSDVQKKLIAGASEDETKALEARTKALEGSSGYLGLKGLCDIITCRKATIPTKGLEGLRTNLLDIYSKAGYGLVLGATPKDPYDSLFVSILALCVPGIVFNLDKMRQIECRYVYCLEKEIPAGIATTKACQYMYKYQKCKYVTGELFHLVPPLAAVDVLLNRVKSIITDPIGFFNLVVTALCRPKCATSGALTGICLWYAWAKYGLDILNDLAEIEAVTRTINRDYCSEVL